MAVPVSRIAYLPLFQGLDEKVLSTLAGMMVARNYPAHNVIFHKGDAAESLAFVLRGTLQVVDLSEDGRAVGISTLKVGQCFGEIAVIDGKTRSASVLALEPSEVAHLPRQTARQLMLHHPLIAERIMLRLTEIIHNSSRQQALLSVPNALQRVFLQIQQLAEQTRDGINIDSLPKQHEMASIVNTSRETVSRAIQLLQKAGIIEKKGRVILIKKKDQLRQAAENGTEAIDIKSSGK